MDGLPFGLPPLLKHLQEGLDPGAELAFVSRGIVGAHMQEGHPRLLADGADGVALHIKGGTGVDRDADHPIHLPFRQGVAQLVKAAAVGRHDRARDLQILFRNGFHGV